MYEIGVSAGLPSALSPEVLRNTFAQDLLLEGRELAEVVYLKGRSKPDLGKVRGLRAAGISARPQRSGPGMRACDASGAAVGVAEQLRMALFDDTNGEDTARVGDMHEFFVWIGTELPALLDRWDAERGSGT
ncbi:hypothetical protein [Nocardia sp. NPDC047038]|uniref:hypothetical protein n=1 Tax=Nocardia sp. NPDC047038 TaxID=3154338 RepID=UPI0033D3AE85